MSALSHADGGMRKPPRPLWYLATILGGLAWLGAFGGVEADAETPCADADTTVAMRECLDKEYIRADAALNAVWKKVMAQVSAADHLPAKEAKEWKDELLASQRAWIQFKEHDCDAAGFEWYGGTGAPGAILSCLLEHTEARTSDLKARYLDR